MLDGSGRRPGPQWLCGSDSRMHASVDGRRKDAAATMIVETCRRCKPSWLLTDFSAVPCRPPSITPRRVALRRSRPWSLRCAEPWSRHKACAGRSRPLHPGQRHQGGTAVTVWV